MTFPEFVRRKTEDALAAVLPPYVTDLEDPAEDAVAVGNDWSRSVFDGPFYVASLPQSKRPACNLVFVQSSGGNTGARDPAALGGGDTDKHVVYEGLSRVAADAVMAGAETIRGGRIVFSVWHPELVHLRASLEKPRHPIQVVATLRGLDLDRGILFNTSEVPVVLVTVASCSNAMSAALAKRPWIDTIAMERPSDLRLAFERLRAMGVERMSCVGGRRIAAQLIDLELVDDIYVTTSPRAGGEPNTPIHPGPLPVRRTVVVKRGTAAERGVVFRHYAMR